MTTDVMVEIDWLSQATDEGKQDEVQHNFDMPIPTYVVLHLTDKLYDKMKTMQLLLKEHKISSIEIISSTIKDTEHSTVDLYYDDKPIKLAHYHEVDKDIPVFDIHTFMLKTTKRTGGKWVASFLYCNDSDTFPFETREFILP